MVVASDLHKDVKVQPRAVKSTYASVATDWAVRFLNLFVAHGKGDLFLQGGFAPVEEGQVVKSLPVKGTLPECLNGEYVRNGPNPKFKPEGLYHWFDGDGMLHGVRIHNGKASYVNRFVRTNKLRQEEEYGAAKFIKIGDMVGVIGYLKAVVDAFRFKLGVLDKTEGAGTGNTALVFHGGRLLALHEGDAPYAVRVMDDGELETVGRQTYDGKLQHTFTAHPKVDPVTGEMFTFGYDVEKQPYVTYRVVSADGVMGPPIPITIPKPVMMHDFAITEQYAIFFDLPLHFDGSAMIKGGFLVNFDTTTPARFGILPRYAKTEAQIKWFELPNHYIFHTSNAWEEGDEVVLIACHIPYMELNKIATEDHEVKSISSMHMYRFNMKTGQASMKQLADFFSDFPRINESYVGRKQRYAYCSVMRLTKIIGVAKYDLTKEPQLGEGNTPRIGGTCVGYFSHGNGRFGSEPVFVPKNPGMGGPEDDGYLMNFVHDENTGVSEVVIIDAKTMSPEPTAVVTMPRRVPYGFHGIFVSEEQIQAQKPDVRQRFSETYNGDTQPLLRPAAAA